MHILKNYLIVFCGITLMLGLSVAEAAPISGSTMVKPHRGACRPLNYSTSFVIQRDDLPNLKNYSDGWPYKPTLSHELPSSDQLCAGVKYHFIVHIMVKQGSDSGGTVVITQKTNYVTTVSGSDWLKEDFTIYPEAFAVRSKKDFVGHLMGNGTFAYPMSARKASVSVPMFFPDRIQDPNSGDIYLLSGTLTIQSESSPSS